MTAKTPSTFLLLSTALIANGVFMGMEVTAARMIAPFFGLTVIVWSFLIAVILVSLTIGSLIGGRLARLGSSNTLGAFLCAAGAAIALSTALNDAVNGWIMPRLGVEWGAFLSILLLWGPPSVFLGAVNPQVFAFWSARRSDSGGAYALMAAVSTIGSVIGALSCGLFLVEYVGTQAILKGCFVLLMILGLTFARRKIVPAAAAALILGVLTYLPARSSPETIFATDTPYTYLEIRERTQVSSGWTVREMILDPYFTSASLVIPDSSADQPHYGLHRSFAEASGYSTLSYIKFGKLIKEIAPQASSFLFLGGGGYVIPQIARADFPEAKIDVVEIDPVVTEAAMRFFNLAPSARISTVTDDARHFLNRVSDTYDVIFVDVFTSGSTPPFWMTTVEAFRDIKSALNPGGVVLTNAIGVLNGSGSEFINGLFHTQASVLPYNRLFAASDCKIVDRVQNFIIVASLNDFLYRQTPDSRSICVNAASYRITRKFSATILPR